jgi:poly-gamma-glutamate synthesis protein (capsule biosynthesis protein)
VNAVGLANNHALDFGPIALEDTLRHLEEAGIAVAGAGGTIDEARRGVIVDCAEVKLGLLAVSDHPAEFAAERDALGISYADLRRGVPEWLLAEIHRLRGASDLLLAFPHWGPNMTVAPAEWQRRAAVELLRAGADLIAGHSAHVFHGVEATGHGAVLYDLGDALDDYAIDAELRNDLGLLALCHVDAGETALELVGLTLEYCRTELATGTDAEWIAARLARACGELGTGVERIGEQRFRIVPPPPP